MKNLLTVLFLSTLNVIAQNTNVGKPPNSKSQMDSLIEIEENLVRSDIAAGKVIYVSDVPKGFQTIRYRNELEYLCDSLGLIESSKLSHDPTYWGFNRMGKYKELMDSVITIRYGKNFKDSLAQEADQRFLAKIKVKNGSVASYECNETPRLPQEGRGIPNARYGYIKPLQVFSPKIIKKPGTNYWPSMRISFSIAVDGSISNFRLSGFDAATPENEQFKDELFKLALQYLNTAEYRTWVPGIVKGVYVASEYTVTVQFDRSWYE
jgi:hypothetical protein